MPLTRTLLACPFLPTTAVKPTVPHRPTIHRHGHHTRRATASVAPSLHPTQKAHMVGIHGGLPIFCLLHVDTVGKVIDVPPTHPKNKQHSTTSALPSSRSRCQFIPQTPICQTKRQSVLWKAHTNFYVINNPLVNSPTRGSFRAAPTRTRKNTCCHPKENPAGKPSRQPIRTRGADTPPDTQQEPHDANQPPPTTPMPRRAPYTPSSHTVHGYWHMSAKPRHPIPKRHPQTPSFARYMNAAATSTVLTLDF